MDRRTGVVLARRQAGIGRQLSSRVKARNIGHAGDDLCRGGIADAGNGGQEVALLAQLWMLVEQVVNGPLDGGDALI